jgi:hypothetical protein
MLIVNIYISNKNMFIKNIKLESFLCYYICKNYFYYYINLLVIKLMYAYHKILSIN